MRIKFLIFTFFISECSFAEKTTTPFGPTHPGSGDVDILNSIAYKNQWNRVNFLRQPIRAAENNTNNEEIVSIGFPVQVDSMVTMERMGQKIEGFFVYNSNGVRRTQRGTHMGLVSSPPIVEVYGFEKDFNIQAIAKFNGPNGLSGRALVMPEFSIDQCRRYLNIESGNAHIVTDKERLIIDNNWQAIDPFSLSYIDIIRFDPTPGANNADQIEPQYCLYDTFNREVFKNYSAIQGIVYGGNGKIGRHYYATGGRGNLPSSRMTSNMCQGVGPNGLINVFSINNEYDRSLSYDQYYGPSISPVTYQCSQNPPRDDVNDAFGVFADTFYHASKTIEMLLHPDWGNIPRDRLSPIKLGIHYAVDSDNAFFDSKAVYFGDGSRFGFFPLGSCQDVVSHEMGHNFTSIGSRLEYTGESGCLNEAFSDLFGEMVENFATGRNDFLIATDCMKSADYLRNMSVIHRYEEYFGYGTKQCGSTCTDPHYCSAVPNYIFYVWSNMPGWTIQDVGRAAIQANLIYWRRQTTILEAGCHLAQAVCDLSLPRSQANIDFDSIVKAFLAGGVDISSCTEQVKRNCRNSAQTPPPGNVLNNCKASRGHSARTGEQLKFRIKANKYATTRHIQIYADNGDADLYVKARTQATKAVWDDSPYWQGSSEWVVERISPPLPNDEWYFIMIDAAEAFNNLDIYACFI